MTRRSTRPWSRSHDRRSARGAGRDGHRAADAAEAPDAAAETPDAPPPIELTEAALEALLFVAEKPLTRREIAALAGTDRATVDARLGDLEVSLRERGIRLLIDGDRVELATAAEGGALVARYVGADAVRLSPASLETLAIVAYRQPVTKGAVERIRGVDSDYTMRTLLHRRFIVELGRSEAPGRPFLYGTGFEFLERFGLTSLDEMPPLDVDVAARLAEEGGEPITEPLFPPDDPGTGAGATAERRGLMATERLQKVLAAAGCRLAPGQRGADRQWPGHGRRQAGQARDAGRPREGDHRRRRQGHRCRLGARVPDAPQARRRHVHGPRPPRLQDRARHDPDGDASRGRPPLPGRTPRPGFRGPARADQRRGVGGSGAPSAPRHRARIRDRACGRRSARTRSRPSRPASRSTRVSPR